jgi:hypothetical protein
MSVHGNTFRFRQNQRHLGSTETGGSALAFLENALAPFVTDNNWKVDEGTAQKKLTKLAGLSAW